MVDVVADEARGLIYAITCEPEHWMLFDTKHPEKLLNDLRLFQIDLGEAAGKPVLAQSLGHRLKGKQPDSRGSLSIGPDGQVYSALRIDNTTGFGTGYLHHLLRFDPGSKKMADLGVITVKNSDFFDFKGHQAQNPDGSLRPRHGFHTLASVGVPQGDDGLPGLAVKPVRRGFGGWHDDLPMACAEDFRAFQGFQAVTADRWQVS